jgi:hypothetical protein
MMRIGHSHQPKGKPSIPTNSSPGVPTFTVPQLHVQKPTKKRSPKRNKKAKVPIPPPTPMKVSAQVHETDPLDEEEINEETEAIQLSEEFFNYYEQEQEAARCAKINKQRKRYVESKNMNTRSEPEGLPHSGAGPQHLEPQNNSVIIKFIIYMLVLSLFFYVCDLHPIAIFITIGACACNRFNIELTNFMDLVSYLWNAVQLYYENKSSKMKNLTEMTLPCVKKTEIVDPQQIDPGMKKLAKSDQKFVTETNIVHYTPDDACTRTVSRYNYRIQVKCNNDSYVMAEIDTDSHLSLISENYFNELSSKGDIEILNEQKVLFSGIGSNLKSNYPPIMLKIQIGRVILEGRFVVTSLLTSSPILLGSDFLTKNKVSIGAFEDGWYCTVGTYDKPLGRVSAFVSSKLTLSTSDDVCLKLRK